MPTRLPVNPRDPSHRTLESLRAGNVLLREALADLHVTPDTVHEFDVRLALVIHRLFSEEAKLELEVDFEHVLKLEMEADLLTLRGRHPDPPPLPAPLAERFPDAPHRGVETVV